MRNGVMSTRALIPEAPKASTSAAQDRWLRGPGTEMEPHALGSLGEDEALLHPSVTSSQGAPPSPPPHWSGRHTDFVGLPAEAGSPHIADGDEMRALATRVLVRELLPRLGLDPARIVVRVDGQAQRRLEARQANGLQENATIHLHPQRYHPKTSFGRTLLAHEAVHVAQREGSVAGDVEQAEHEADAIAEALVHGGVVRRPLIALPSAVAAASAATETRAASTPADNGDLGALVRSTHEGELALMRRALSYGVFDWVITDDDVRDVLRILESLPFPTQIEMVSALEEPFPARLAGNVNPVHFKRFRTPILAAYCALVRRGNVAALQDDPFAGMAFTGLTPEEHYGLREVLAAFLPTPRGAAWLSGLKELQRAQVDDVQHNKPDYDEREQRQRATEDERKRKAEKVEDAQTLKARTDDVGGFLAEARRKLTYRALDWAITNGEARSLLDGAGRFADEPAVLRAIVNSLEGDGLMDRWVDNVPVEDLYTDVPAAGARSALSRRQMLLKLLVLRPAWKNARMAEELLSYGLFDWAITDEDAFLASQLIKALPERVREGVYADEDYAKRLDEELSRSMKKSRSANYYTGGEGGSDLQSIKAQLLEDPLWTKEQMSRLRMLIQMARAADEARWVFAQSKDRFGHKGSTLPVLYADAEFFNRVVQAFGLYVPVGWRRPDGAIDKGRTEYVAEQLEGKPFGSDNIFAWAWRYVRYLVQHTGDLHVQIIGDTVVGGRRTRLRRGAAYAGRCAGGRRVQARRGAGRSGLARQCADPEHDAGAARHAGDAVGRRQHQLPAGEPEVPKRRRERARPASTPTIPDRELEAQEHRDATAHRVARAQRRAADRSRRDARVRADPVVESVSSTSHPTPPRRASRRCPRASLQGSWSFSSKACSPRPRRRISLSPPVKCCSWA